MSVFQIYKDHDKEGRKKKSYRADSSDSIHNYFEDRVPGSRDSVSSSHYVERAAEMENDKKEQLMQKERQGASRTESHDSSSFD